MSSQTKSINTKNKNPSKFKGKILTKLSSFGKVLLFPVSMLPFAAILLRLGVAVPSNGSASNAFTILVSQFLASAGNIIFQNISIFFAVAIAFGLTKQKRGEAAIVGLLGMFLVMVLLSSNADPTNKIPAPTFFGGVDLPNKIYGHINLGGKSPGFHSIFNQSYNSIFAANVFNGILVGSLVAWTYNSFSKIEMPGVLGFFSGSRLVPAVTIVFILTGIWIYAIIWPWIGYGIYEFSTVLGKAQGNRFSNASIMLVYGILNRLLIPFGLHFVPNTLFWFQFGDFAGYHGDINIFLKGPASYNGMPNPAGTFQSGFFPIFMFGLPALVCGIWRSAIPEQRIKVLGLLGGSAIVSFFTGITEPIEYAFLYVAPLLYGMHVIFTGIFSFIVGLFGIQLGFAFSAGFIDYVLSIPKSFKIISDNYHGFDAVIRNPIWIFPIGIFTAASYYFGSVFLIKHYNLSTPGRGDNLIVSAIIHTEEDSKSTGKTRDTKIVKVSKYTKAAKIIINGLGDESNITDVGNCATRLRVTVKDSAQVKKDLLKSAGALGVIVLSKTSVQIIMGTTVELFANAINDVLGKSN